MKQRFSSLDLQIISHELSQTLVGHRLSNIYDLTSRIFLLKFHRSNPSSKHLFVIDSGFRCHLTKYTRETSPTPSSFTSKLRKFLRTRRLTAVEQLGVDRVLKLTFSDGLYFLFLEFFAGGNVILTDEKMVQLAVLRLVPAGEDGRGECKPGVVYDAAGKERSSGIEKERIREVLQDAVEESAVSALPPQPQPQPQQPSGGKKYQKKQKKKDTTLKRVLGAKLAEFSPVLIEHCLLGAGVEPSVKVEEVLVDEAMLEKVVGAFGEAERIVKDITEGAGVKKGYIIAKQPSAPKAAEKEKEQEATKSVGFGSAEAVEQDNKPEEVQMEGEAKGLVFDDFHPFLPRQFVDIPGLKTLEYEGFNKTVDTFFSSIESQKLESRLREREEAAKRRLEAARTDHLKRVEVLRDVQDVNVCKAQALQDNADRVEEAIAAVNGLISQGMDWVQAARLIEGEQKRGNAVAELIQLPLKLYENKITLKLRQASYDDLDEESGKRFVGFDDDEEDEGDTTDEEKEDKEEKKLLTIDVDLSLSAYANARTYYDQKRSAAEKETKTLQSSAKALKSTERKIAADLKKGLGKEKQLLRPVRVPLWFEKFLFFISSDGYLVLGGHDAQQNEILYKRYFKKGDVYVHADIQGASIIIVKNNPATPNAPIPPSTLQQAGTLSVAMSQAWDSKAVLSAWWVGFDQVSKLAPTGDYLPVGTFNIKGTKNFLPPAQLILGYGVLWKVDEESKKKHMKHRIEEPSEERTTTTQEQEQEQEEQAETGKPEEKEEAPQEDSDDEEFPDAKLESDHEQDKSEDEDEDEAFPDIRLQSVDETEPTSEPHPELVEAEYEIPEEGPLSPPATPASPPAPRHLTAKQKRDLKKGRPLPPNSTPVSTEPSRSSSPSTTATSSNKPLPRGKRNKAKRAAVKYSHQDEEDRALALALLGVGARAEKEAEKAAPKESAEARKVRLREQHARAQAVGLAEEARRHGAAEDSDEGEAEAEVEDTPLDALIPDPYDTDTLLDAIPVCAPWGAMGRYKWRIKLQPGAQKKGKAIREVLHGWVGEKGRMKGKEKELVLGWKDTEAVACVGVGKIKVFSTGSAEKGAEKGKKAAAGGAKRGRRGGGKK